MKNSFERWNCTYTFQITVYLFVSEIFIKYDKALQSYRYITYMYMYNSCCCVMKNKEEHLGAGFLKYLIILNFWRLLYDIKIKFLVYIITFYFYFTFIQAEILSKIIDNTFCAYQFNLSNFNLYLNTTNLETHFLYNMENHKLNDYHMQNTFP